MKAPPAGSTSSPAGGRQGQGVQIVTAGDWKFREILRLSQDQSAKFGYEHTTYDLGNLGFGLHWNVRNLTYHSVHKPSMILHRLASLRDGEVLCYLDGDAVAIKSIHSIETAVFDVAVTVRDSRDIKRIWSRGDDGDLRSWLGCINAGVMFFRKTNAAICFCETWHERTAEFGDDQAALNCLLNPDQKILGDDHLVIMPALKLRTLRSDKFNWGHWPEEPLPETRVVHCKGYSWQGTLDRLKLLGESC